MSVYIKRVANYTRNQLNYFYNSLLHKTCFRTAEKEVILFTIEFFVISRYIISKTISKDRRTIILFDHDEKKRRKKFKNEMIIVILSVCF